MNRLPRLGQYVRLTSLKVTWPQIGARMARQTRLVLVAPNGTRVQTDDRRLVGIDLTDIPNADTAAPIDLVVEQQCDLEHWHQTARHPLPNYDTEWQPGDPVHH